MNYTVIKLHKMHRHPNADSLGVTSIDGQPVVYRLSDFPTAETLGVFFPIDTVVDCAKPWFSFLGEGQQRIKARRLRGVFSMGLLLPWTGEYSLLRENEHDIEHGECIGQVDGEVVGAKKYQEKPHHLVRASEQASAPLRVPPDFHVEGYRKYGYLLRENPGRVIATEKVHGMNSRFLMQDGRLHVGSHHCWWKPRENNLWWVIAKKYNLESLPENKLVWGEIFGPGIQDLHYGQKEPSLAVFDIYDIASQQWMSHRAVEDFCIRHNLPTVPVVYEGPLDDALLRTLAEQPSHYDPAQIREGLVIAHQDSNIVTHIGRLKLKLISEQYYLRKNGTEHK